MLSEKYWKKYTVSTPPETAYDRKIKGQENCTHAKWRKVCSHCGKQISSEITDESIDKTHEHIL